MDRIRVSVIVTTHFRNDMLAECLEALASQTLPLPEVVVVDDGGSGSARAVVERFGAGFHYVWQENGGLQNARNRGVRETTGNWIAFLDDDDIWLPERHALIVGLAGTNEVDVISGDFKKFSGSWVAPEGVFSEIAKQSPGLWHGISFDSASNFVVVGQFDTTRLLPAQPFWPSTLVLRRDLLLRLNGWNEKLRGIRSEDIEFVFRALRIGKLGLILPATLLYRVHDGNAASSSLAVALGRTRIWEILLADPATTPHERIALTQAIDTLCHGIIYTAFAERRFRTVISTSNKLRVNELSAFEKVKIVISMVAVWFIGKEPGSEHEKPFTIMEL